MRGIYRRRWWARQYRRMPVAYSVASAAHTLSGAVVESSSDTATGAISFQHYISGAVVESSTDTATGAISFQHYVSGAVVESGADTATGTIATTSNLSGAVVESAADTATGTILGQSNLSGAVVESGRDSASGVLDNPQAIVPKTGAGSPSKKRRRRIELDGRLYEVDERDVPALLEAVIRDSKPPGTAEVVEPAKPSPRSPKRAAAEPVQQMPEPMSVDLVVERFAMLQQDLARQAEQDVLRMLDRVAQRVLAEVEDEDEALVALLLA